MSEAARIAVRRRKTYAGPTRVFRCRWCHNEIRGRVPLEAHERNCSLRPTGELAEFTDADLRAMAWHPDDAPGL